MNGFTLIRMNNEMELLYIGITQKPDEKKNNIKLTIPTIRPRHTH